MFTLHNDFIVNNYRMQQIICKAFPQYSQSIRSIRGVLSSEVSKRINSISRVFYSICRQIDEYTSEMIRYHFQRNFRHQKKIYFRKRDVAAFWQSSLDLISRRACLTNLMKAFLEFRSTVFISWRRFVFSNSLNILRVPNFSRKFFESSTMNSSFIFLERFSPCEI